MSILTEKQEELESIQTARFIATTLRDISAMQIRSLREEFRRNYTFYREIGDLYQLVKRHAQYRNMQEEAQENTAATDLVVAVTSNKRFYGTLNSDVMDAFLERVEEGRTYEEYLVIGQTGKQYVSGAEYESQCQFTTFADDTPSEEEVRTFLDRIKDYRRVFLYYPGFVGIFQQEPRTIDITYTPEPERSNADPEERIGYIFEPELPEMVAFFETQVRHLLFDRTILETKLSRTAARLVKMNGADQRASDLIEEVQRELRQQSALLSNMRLLETFSGIAQWKKR